MESTVTQDLEGHSVWLPEIKMEPEDNDESASEPRVIEVEPTPPEFAFVKLETEDPVIIACQPEIENLQESDRIKHEPASSPGTPTHSTTLDNITSQLDQATHKSSTTQPQLHLRQEVSVKPESNVNQCIVCQKVFSRRDNLERHLSSHSDNREVKVHQCTVCNKVLSRKDHLERHLLLRHSAKFVHKCEECGQSFKTADILTKHQQSHKLCRYVCPQCNRAFSTGHQLQNHLLTHSGIRDKKCDDCGKCFIRRDSLIRHQQTLHKPGGYECAHCDTAARTKLELASHIKQFHMPDNDGLRFVCTICFKSFPFKLGLRRHMMIHKIQRCKICKLGCADPASLRTHMSVAHEGKEEYKCRTCGKLYFIYLDLASHEASHVSKPFKCSFCHKRFITDDRLELHVKNQHSITQFDCDVCPKSFPSESYLKRHKLNHTKPEQCDICHRAFCFKFQLVSHMSKVHASN